jgi:hypothetical protein
VPEMRTPAGRERLTASPVPIVFDAHSRDATASKRRWRHGARGPVPVEIRNGLPPFRPYVYRGLGYDQLTGDDDD